MVAPKLSSMKEVLTIPGAIEGLTTRKDKTVRLTIGTQEMAPATAATLFRLQNAYIYLAIKEEDFGREDLEALQSMEAEMTDDVKKTHSQRLRAVLYRIWEQNNKGHTDFTSFYFAEMEKIITHYKNKLP